MFYRTGRLKRSPSEGKLEDVATAQRAKSTVRTNRTHRGLEIENVGSEVQTITAYETNESN